ncbi:uncharacterized protein LOC117343756 isoform X1 [Pecten maximus]|uniref:uncharacterized protein LOC117343756 isoform X1 n=1 Tax=Pecten maximus TaxID=6579 RepID=UPI0014587453|nr:uncharacterized protein LOC117343756 isoform X1 [Pecten maximus]
MFQCTFFTMTLLILLVLLPLVETSNFPKSCHVKNGVIDCSGVSMRDVQVEKDRIFHQIRRLYFKDVLHFYLTCSQFPNVDFLRIEHTPLPCDHFRLCGGVNIVLNRIVCDRDATTTMFPTSGETSPTTTLRTTMSPASGETSPTTTLRTTMSPASGETSPTTTLRTTMFPTSGETSPTTTLRTTSSNTPASIFGEAWKTAFIVTISFAAPTLLILCMIMILRKYKKNNKDGSTIGLQMNSLPRFTIDDESVCELKLD